MDKLLPSQSPPGGLKPEEIPLFVSVGFDDNDKSGLTKEKGIEGMKWAVDMFMARKNPDGSPCRCAFYCTTEYIMKETAEDPPHLVKKSWKEALDNGFEFGCHTHSHSDGTHFTVDEWVSEINTCLDILAQPYVEGSDSNDTGIGIAKEAVRSFRSPFLSYNANMPTAVQQTGFVFDSSIEEGYDWQQNGTNCYFPYTLDEGSPGNEYNRTFNESREALGSHPGLWELPICTFVVPPDEACEKYGIKKGLRQRCHDQRGYFSLEDGKLSGFDYNCLSEFQMSGDEYSATLKYTMDLRLEGNRAPFMVGAHTGIYAKEYDSDPVINISEAERRKAVEDFLDYALSKPEVRIVPPSAIIQWMRSPTALI